MSQAEERWILSILSNDKYRRIIRKLEGSVIICPAGLSVFRKKRILLVCATTFYRRRPRPNFTYWCYMILLTVGLQVSETDGCQTREPFHLKFSSYYNFIYQLTACMTTNNVKQFLVFSKTASFPLKTILERVRNFRVTVMFLPASLNRE